MYVRRLRYIYRKSRGKVENFDLRCVEAYLGSVVKSQVNFVWPYICCLITVNTLGPPAPVNFFVCNMRPRSLSYIKSLRERRK